MRNAVDFLTGNLIINLAFLGWAAAQVLKLFVTLITERRWDWQHLLSSGGMPSSHSACVCACAAPEEIFDRALKELVGHTPLPVRLGALRGTAVGWGGAYLWG